jgi:hypothetical protein
MDYKATDFVNMRFNPYPMPDKTDLLKEFKALGLYKTFRIELKGYDKNKVIRYILYAFDPGSPVISISDVIQRRVDAALLAGFTLEDSSFEQSTEMMIKSMVPEINHMIIQFCLLLNESDYAILTAYQDSLRKTLEKLMDQNEETDLKTNIQSTNTLRTEIKNLYASILQDNHDHMLSRSLTQFAQAEMLELSPEYFAEITREWDNIPIYYKKKKNGNE